MRREEEGGEGRGGKGEEREGRERKGEAVGERAWATDKGRGKSELGNKYMPKGDNTQYDRMGGSKSGGR